MSEPEKKEKDLKKNATIASLVAASALGLVLLCLVAFRIYLATSYPASQLSRLVTDRLQQEFTVKEIGLSGRTLILKGVRLKNPAGFASGELFSADRVVIAPRWIQLLRGRQRFELIDIEGGKLALEKGARGTWNFTGIRRRLAARRPAGKAAPETVIGKLLVKNSSITIQGEGVHGINLQVFNLASGGSRSAQVELAFEDGARNRYLLTGTARPGADAAVDLSLKAPSISLKNLASLFKLKDPEPFQDAQGALQASAVLAKGELKSTGSFSFRKVLIPAARGDYPIAGLLQFNGVYNLSEDTAHLDEATLTIDKMARLQAGGTVTGVKKERVFDLLVSMDAVDLALINVLLPEESRHDLNFGGRLRCESLRLEGNGRAGIESVVGNLQLRDGLLARENDLIAAGVAGDLALSRRGATVSARGKFSLPRPEPKALVQALELPVELTLSAGLKPLRARSEALSARVMGVAVSGSAAYDVGSSEPLRADLAFTTREPERLNPWLSRYGMEAFSGTGTGSVRLAAKGAQELNASARVTVANLKGKQGKDSIGVKAGTATATVKKRGEKLQVHGDARLAAFSFQGKSGDALFAYHVADRYLYLNGLQASWGETRFSATSLSGELPAAAVTGQLTRRPLRLDLEGGALGQGNFQLSGIAGRVRGSLVGEGKEKWLEGSADLASRALSWRNAAMAAPVLHATFARQGGRAELHGQLLGGKVAGKAAFRPFAPGAPSSFNVSITGAAAKEISRLAAGEAGTRPSAGSVELKLEGTNAWKSGLSCRFDARGRDIALVNATGKTLVSGAAASVKGRLSGGTLTIDEGTVMPGRGVTLTARGEIADALSDKRRGTLLLALPETSLNDLVESLINLAPPLIQEATVKGSVAAEGRIELREGRKVLNCGVTVRGGRVEAPAQKFLVADLNGRVPLSLDFGGKGSAAPRAAGEFSRENYPRVLAQLRATPPGGDLVTVEKIGFGSVQTGKLSAQLRAQNGLTEITSLRTTLYDGTVLGRGHLLFAGEATYRGDLLVNGLSMKALCRSLPNLEGYISGRVDGVISMHGIGGDQKRLTGFVDLWAREGGGEKMLVSKQFLQRLAKQKLSGFFLSSDRAYDKAEIKATLERGELTFNALQILNTNALGIKDLNVNIAPTQNRIALDHLLESIKEAAVRGVPATGGEAPAKKPQQEPAPEFKWEE
ncbi:AsmA family protein [Citrifermentans bremense]|uniref:AsmA family protein n=1 Tax=Citrifermentans bremense TaxID=60035 RepID=UPI0003FE782A|nr:AsmA family protein [Citrifermentans bremense]